MVQAITVRIEGDLYELLRRWSFERKVSMNAVVSSALAAYMAPDGPPAETRGKVEKLPRVLPRKGI